MSFIKKLFSSPKNKKGPTLAEAILKLKATEEILNKKQVFLEERIKREIEVAKKNVKSNKKVALQAVQRKKRLELQLTRVDGVLTTLEAQREILENANTNTLAMVSMEKASKALKELHKNLDADKVDRLLDDLAQQREVTDEIAEALTQPVNENDIDELELERELEEISKISQPSEPVSIDQNLPAVPQDKVKIKPKDTDGTQGEKETLMAT